RPSQSPQQRQITKNELNEPNTTPAESPTEDQTRRTTVKIQNRPRPMHPDPTVINTSATSAGVEDQEPAVLSVAKGYDTAYLTDAVAGGREGYYTGAVAAGEPAGLWYGRGAAELGLSSEVDAELLRA